MLVFENIEKEAIWREQKVEGKYDSRRYADLNNGNKCVSTNSVK